MESIESVTKVLRPHWHIAYTLPRHEKAVASRLTSQGVESYLPLYSAPRCWNHRQVLADLPLFPGYVFVRMLLSDRIKILSRPGIIRLLNANGDLAIFPDDEMESLRSSLAIWKATPYPFLTTGKHVRIRSGPFAGLQGTIIRRKGKMRLLVTLDIIQSAMLLELEAAEAELAG